MYRRGELIPDAQTVVFIIESGRHIMHEKTVLSASQLRTWSAGRIIDKVAEKKLYRTLPDSVL